MPPRHARSIAARVPRPTPAFETLEPRTLLTATVVRGVLSVRGTAADDIIEIRRSAADSTQIEVVENGMVTLSRPLAGLRQIRVDTGAGNDQAIVNGTDGAITIPTILNGGRGDDLLRGGTGTNLINGGPGRDAYEPGGGRDRVSDATRADRLVRAGSAAAFREYLGGAARSRSRFGMVPAAENGVVRAVAPPTNTAITATATAANDPSPAAGNNFSQTNTQVTGVDEGDVIENDGSSLYVLSNDELLIVDARDPAAPTVASRTTLDGWPIAEYLNAGRLTVLSSVWDQPPAAPGTAMPFLRMRQPGQVQVTVFDVSDRAAPAVVSRTRIDGSYCDSRMVDGRLALIVRNDLLGGYWDGGPCILRPAIMPVAATADLPSAAPPVATSDVALVRLVQRSPVGRMLPTWTTTPGAQAGGKTTGGLVSQPQDILCPAMGNDASLTSIVIFDTMASPRIVGATSVIGGYASLIHLDGDDLYLFSPRWNAVTGDQTDVQRFAIATGTPRLVASGTFVGSLIDQFSADSEAGMLRVAVTSTTFVPAVADDSSGNAQQTSPIWFSPWTMQRRNAVQVLATQGDTLRVVGSLDDIAPGESIQSARFIGDRAYVCTFLQVDPLFTIDLSTPTAPRVLGELKVPGYSRFLQPFGSGQLIGIGRDADPATGRTTGLKVSLFDVSDDAAPAEVSSYVVEQPENGWSWSDAEWNVHALGFFADVGVLALPVEAVRPPDTVTAGSDEFTPWTSEYGVVVLHVDAASGITRLGTITHDSPLLRTARIGDVIFSVASRDLQAVALASAGSLSPRGAVVLREEAPPSSTVASAPDATA